MSRSARTPTAVDPWTSPEAAKAEVKASRPWFKKKRWWLLALVLIVTIATQIGGDDAPPTTAAASMAADTAEPTTAVLVPVSVAANIFDLDVNVLAQSRTQGSTTCDAVGTSTAG